MERVREGCVRSTIKVLAMVREEREGEREGGRERATYLYVFSKAVLDSSVLAISSFSMMP